MIPFLVIMAWVVPMIVGAIVGSNVERGGEGFFYAFVLGWIGVVIIVALTSTQRRMQPASEHDVPRWQR
jgi:uncharacterized membrane protein YeaQ/YmgE (transglycosylase-associated protein family)